MDIHLLAEPPSLTTALATAIVVVYGVYILASFLLESPLLEVFWNILVSCLPTALLVDVETRRALRSSTSRSQKHAAKSNALRNMLGLSSLNRGLGAGILDKLPSSVVAGRDVAAAGVSSVISRALSVGSGAKKSFAAAAKSDAPAGLGNWDNSCYQNSVLQALSSLTSVREWLVISEPLGAGDDQTTTNRALQETLTKLCDPAHNGQHIWTPAKLKNMSSWQQQDAQEYYSKIMDELDKDALKAARSRGPPPRGLEMILQQGPILGGLREEQDVDTDAPTAVHHSNPIEGLVAQRVACTNCGFSDGFSMIPFNCLTVPLGSAASYSLEDCLDEYTKREAIEGVECRSCTLRHTANRLQQLLPASTSTSRSQPATATPQPSASSSLTQLPPELRSQIAARLLAVQQALSADDFTDQTLKEACQIPSKAFVSSTKTREAFVARAPRSLVIHINRSVFDEFTGAQRKNFAAVQYPFVLDLRRWMLLDGGPSDNARPDDDAAADRTPPYRLTAVVTHYGRHENGHYICYRRHPREPPPVDMHPDPDDDFDPTHVQDQWWRLSDEDVTPASPQAVQQQGAGVFMLFYERDDSPRPGPAPAPPPASAAAAASAEAASPPSSIPSSSTLSSPVTLPASSTAPSVATYDTDTDLDLDADDDADAADPDVCGDPLRIATANPSVPPKAPAMSTPAPPIHIPPPNPAPHRRHASFKDAPAAPRADVPRAAGLLRV